MSKRNRELQRAARQLADIQNIFYTEARGLARRGSQATRIISPRAKVDAVGWSRLGRWIHHTSDWRHWRVRCGSCGRVQGPDCLQAAGLPVPPELAFTACISRLVSEGEERVCPPVCESDDYYFVLSRTGRSQVLRFAVASEFIERPPLTPADDNAVEVPGVTLLPVPNCWASGALEGREKPDPSAITYGLRNTVV